METLKGLLKIMFGGSTLRATERVEYKPLPGKTLVWNGTKFFVSPYVKNSVVLPDAYMFKAFKSFKENELLQVAVDVTKSFTLDSLKSVLGVELVREIRKSRKGYSYCAGLKYKGQQVARRDWNHKQIERFTLRVISLSPFLRARLIESALRSTGLKGVAFPAHPSWISSRRAEAILNGIVSTNGDMFADVCREVCGNISDQDVNVLRIRAGKDGWSEILGVPDSARMMVFPEALSEVSEDAVDADGVIFVKRSTFLDSGKFGLIRGLTRFDDGKIGIVKARALNSSIQASVGPNGCKIPDDIDGWCYDSAIKWSKIDYDGNESVVLDMTIGLTKDEDHEQKDAYKLNLFYLSLGEWDDVTVSDIQGLLQREAVRKAEALNDLPGTMYRHLDKGLSSDEEDVLLDSYLSKYVLGYLSVKDPGVMKALNRRAKSFMSAGVPGSVYAAILHRTHVSVDGGKIYALRPGEFVPSAEMRKSIQSGFRQFSKRTGKRETNGAITAIRYPNTTKGSFLGLTMSEHTLDEVEGILAVLCVEAEKPLQSDDDDHAEFIPGYDSKVRVTDDFGAIDKASVPMEGELTPWTACMHGRWCQERTALLVAAYMKCLSTVYDHKPEALGDAQTALLPLAQSIQDSVQGIKKYVGLSVGIDAAYVLCDKVLSELLLGDAWSPTATIISGKLIGWNECDTDTFVGAVNQVYGVELNPVSILDMGAKFQAPNIKAAKTRISAEEREILRDMWVRTHKPMVHVHMVAVDLLLEKIVGTTRKAIHDNPEIMATLDRAKIERAIVLYAIFVQGLVEKNEIANIRGMNGMACLYAERLLG